MIATAANEGFTRLKATFAVSLFGSRERAYYVHHYLGPEGQSPMGPFQQPPSCATPSVTLISGTERERRMIRLIDNLR